MHRLPRQIVLTLCALFLLGAQQAAYTHLIGHLGHRGVAEQIQAQPDDAADHAAALSLSHLCTSCLAISALAAGAPPPALFLAVVVAIDGISPAGEVHRLPLPTAPPYAARAPPQ
ncbi:MAG: hypothetical protein WCV99_15890 [Sterolibacterium sp.]|jgi:hypothetical protein